MHACLSVDADTHDMFRGRALVVMAGIGGELTFTSGAGKVGIAPLD